MFRDREKRREKERERNINVQQKHPLVVPHTPPTGGPARLPGMCPDPESNCNLSVFCNF